MPKFGVLKRQINAEEYSRLFPEGPPREFHAMYQVALNVIGSHRRVARELGIEERSLRRKLTGEIRTRKIDIVALRGLLRERQSQP